MRCQDCQKFVSYDEPTLELESDEITVEVEDKTMTISASPEVRLVLPCGECGAELKEATFSPEFSIEHICSGDIDQDKADSGEFSFDEPEAIDRMEDKDQNGKQIKSIRYMKHMYGMSLTLSGRCPVCNEELSQTQTDEVPASGMDEIG